VYGLYSSFMPKVIEKVSLILPALAMDMGILIVPPMPTRSFFMELLVAILTAYPTLASSLPLFSSFSP
jgi:hypothetical protein